MSYIHTTDLYQQSRARDLFGFAANAWESTGCYFVSWSALSGHCAMSFESYDDAFEKAILEAGMGCSDLMHVVDEVLEVNEAL